MSCKDCEQRQRRCQKPQPKQPPKALAGVVGFVFLPVMVLVTILQAVRIKKKVMIIENNVKAQIYQYVKARKQ
jgi:hypothetical protein